MNNSFDRFHTVWWLLVSLSLSVSGLQFICGYCDWDMQPAVAWLQRRGVSRALGAILMYLVLLALLIGFALLLVPSLVDQIATISASLPDYYCLFHPTVGAPSSE